MKVYVYVVLAAVSSVQRQPRVVTSKDEDKKEEEEDMDTNITVPPHHHPHSVASADDCSRYVDQIFSPSKVTMIYKHLSFNWPKATSTELKGVLPSPSASRQVTTTPSSSSRGGRQANDNHTAGRARTATRCSRGTDWQAHCTSVRKSTVSQRVYCVQNNYS